MVELRSARMKRERGAGGQYATRRRTSREREGEERGGEGKGRRIRKEGGKRKTYRNRHAVPELLVLDLDGEATDVFSFLQMRDEGGKEIQKSASSDVDVSSLRVTTTDPPFRRGKGCRGFQFDQGGRREERKRDETENAPSPSSSSAASHC